jgi:hypothetical protein
MKLLSCFATAAALVWAAAAAHAAPVVFNTAPFEGSTANPDDGVRTVFGANERFLPSFDTAADQFVFGTVFGFESLVVYNGLATGLTGLPGERPNVVVLQDTDNDDNAATAFNAGTAANVIAAALDEDGAGFFIYHNSVLGLNRLVFSSNLNSTTSDLAILARITSPTRGDAIALLPGFDAANFSVPAPASLGLVALGLVAATGASRRKAAAAAV